MTTPQTRTTITRSRKVKLALGVAINAAGSVVLLTRTLGFL